MLVRFEHAGQKYAYDTDTLLVAEARYVKKNAGLTAGEFLQGIAAMDGDALAAMVLLTLRRNGQQLTWDDMGDLDLMPLITSIGEAAAEESAAAEIPAATVVPEAA